MLKLWLFGILSTLSLVLALMWALVFALIGLGLENPVQIYEHNLWIARGEVIWSVAIAMLAIVCLGMVFGEAKAKRRI